MSFMQQIPKHGSPVKKAKKLSTGSGSGLAGTPGTGFAASIAAKNITGKIVQGPSASSSRNLVSGNGGFSHQPVKSMRNVIRQGTGFENGSQEGFFGFNIGGGTLTAEVQQPMIIQRNSEQKPSSGGQMKIQKRRTATQNEITNNINSQSEVSTYQQIRDFNMTPPPIQNFKQESIIVSHNISSITGAQVPMPQPGDIPQTIYVDHGLQMPNNDLNNKIKESVERYLTKKISQPQIIGSKSSGVLKQPQLSLQQPPQIIESKQGLGSKVIYQQMIESFTQKIENLQGIINQQKVQLDIKESEINKLKKINIQLSGNSKINESSILSPTSNYQLSKNDTYDSKLHNENQGLRKFLTSKEPVPDLQERVKILESIRGELEVKISALYEENARLKLQQQSQTPNSSNYQSEEGIQCRLISHKTLEEVKAQNFVLQADLDKEKQTSQLLRHQLAKKDQDLLITKDRRSSDLYSAIQTLKGELEIEKKVAEIETFKNLANSHQEECYQLQETISQLKHQHSSEIESLRLQIQQREQEYERNRPVVKDATHLCTLLTQKAFDEANNHNQKLTEEKGQNLKMIEDLQHQLTEIKAQLDQERQKAQDKQNELDQLRNELMKKSIEGEKEKSKLIIMEANLEAKDHQIKSALEALNAKEKLFEVLIQTEKASAEMRIESERSKSAHLLEVERFKASQLLEEERFQHQQAIKYWEQPFLRQRDETIDCQLMKIKEMLDEQNQAKPIDSSESQVQCEIMVKVNQQDNQAECDIISMRDTNILKARLEELSGNLDEQGQQITYLSSQCSRKDQELFQTLKSLETVQEENQLLLESQSDLEYSRTQTQQLLHDNKLLQQELERIAIAEEARFYIQNMIKRQQDQAVQNYIGNEITLARQAFEKQKLAIVEECEQQAKENIAYLQNRHEASCIEFQEHIGYLQNMVEGLKLQIQASSSRESGLIDQNQALRTHLDAKYYVQSIFQSIEQEIIQQSKTKNYNESQKIIQNLQHNIQQLEYDNSLKIDQIKKLAKKEILSREAEIIKLEIKLDLYQKQTLAKSYVSSIFQVALEVHTLQATTQTDLDVFDEIENFKSTVERLGQENEALSTKVQNYEEKEPSQYREIQCDLISPESLSDLENRLSDAEEQLQGSILALESKNQELLDLEALYNSLHSSLNLSKTDYEARIAAYIHDISELKSEISQQQYQIAHLNQAQDSLIEYQKLQFQIKQQTMEQSQSEMGAKIDELNGQIAILGQQNLEYYSDIEAKDNQLVSMKMCIEDQSNQLRLLASSSQYQISDLQSQLHLLTSKETQETETICDLITPHMLDALHNDNEDLQGQIEQIRSQNDTEKQELNQQIEELKEQNSELQDQIMRVHTAQDEDQRQLWEQKQAEVTQLQQQLQEVNESFESYKLQSQLQIEQLLNIPKADVSLDCQLLSDKDLASLQLSHEQQVSLIREQHIQESDLLKESIETLAQQNEFLRSNNTQQQSELERIQTYAKEQIENLEGQLEFKTHELNDIKDREVAESEIQCSIINLEEVQGYQDEIQTMNSQIKEAKEILESQTSQISEQNSQILQLQEQIETANGLQSQLQEELDELKESSENQLSEVQLSLTEKTAQLEKAQADAELTKSSESAQVAILKSQIQELQTAHEANFQELNDTQALKIASLQQESQKQLTMKEQELSNIRENYIIQISQMQEQHKETITQLETKAQLATEEHTNILSQKDGINQALTGQIKALQEHQEELQATIQQVKEDELQAKEELNLQITALTEQIDSIQGELEVQKETVATKEALISALEEQIAQAKATIELSHQNESEQVKTLETQLEEKKSIIQKQAQETTTIQQELADLKQMMEDKKEENEEHAQANAQLIEAANLTIKQQNQAIEELKVVSQGQLEVITQKETLLAELTSQYQEKESDIQDLEGQIQDKEESIDTLNLEIDKQKELLSKLESSNASLTDQLSTLQSQLLQHQELLQTSQLSLASKTEEQRVSQGIIDAKQEQIADLLSQIQQLKQERDLSHQNESEKVATLEALNETLKATAKDQLTQINARDQEIDQLKVSNLNLKEELIQKLKEASEKAKEELAQQVEAINASKNEEIRELQQQIRDIQSASLGSIEDLKAKKESEIEQLRQLKEEQIQEMNQSVGNLAENNENLRGQVESLTAQISQIRSANQEEILLIKKSKEEETKKFQEISKIQQELEEKSSQVELYESRIIDSAKTLEKLSNELKSKDQVIDQLSKNIVQPSSSNQVEGMMKVLGQLEQDNRDKDKMIEALKNKMKEMAMQFSDNEEAKSLNSSFEKSSTTILKSPSMAKLDGIGKYVFCFGSNHPVSLAKLFETQPSEILNRSISASLKGYGRVFVGTTPAWGNASFANIIEHPKSEVEGYATLMKPEEIKKLETSIGYPQIYNKISIQLKKLPYKEGDELLSGEVYIMVEKSLNQKYKRPSAEYLDATCKTLSASIYLREGPYEDKVHPISLKVFNGTNITLDIVHETFASMKYLMQIDQQPKLQQPKPAPKKANNSHLLF